MQVWLLKGKKDDMYRAMWEKAMDEMIAQMIFTKTNLTYIAELQKCASSPPSVRSRFSPVLDSSSFHRVCI